MHVAAGENSFKLSNLHKEKDISDLLQLGLRGKIFTDTFSQNHSHET